MKRKILDLVSVMFFVLFVLFGSIESDNMIPLFITALAWTGFVLVLKYMEQEEIYEDSYERRT